MSVKFRYLNSKRLFRKLQKVFSRTGILWVLPHPVVYENTSVIDVDKSKCLLFLSYCFYFVAHWWGL